MEKYLKNHNGLTLLEVLLAFSILTIVFIAFLTFFPQIGTFNQITDEKMRAVNVAKQQLVIVQNDFGPKFINNLNTNPQPTNIYDQNNPYYISLNLIEDIDVDENYYLLLTKRQGLLISIKINKEPELSDVRKLYKVEATVVQDDDSRELTKLYGYIVYRNGGN
ncbi:hypothetical protein BKP35_14400 [Anaerobacillus arseniciselenatis]|uniref:Prepilin-type N-terminal cleavage/methylation domain-containing protein n=1 Tax=Anaerobacillus arseniciselenatis TaxID=85682 RepID=A0A1S2LFJ9_9BACI|nr:type II secretion system protein [Anaerobacillus arseniciselenatis]OIJ10285.1 hypothetical protein BKP35_14400 [Anaerobacillus arseniciselenatis]